MRSNGHCKYLNIYIFFSYCYILNDFKTKYWQYVEFESKVYDNSNIKEWQGETEVCIRFLHYSWSGIILLEGRLG